jgi:hypothetical protein
LFVKDRHLANDRGQLLPRCGRGELILSLEFDQERIQFLAPEVGSTGPTSDKGRKTDQGKEESSHLDQAPFLRLPRFRLCRVGRLSSVLDDSKRGR